MLRVCLVEMRIDGGHLAFEDLASQPVGLKTKFFPDPICSRFCCGSENST